MNRQLLWVSLLLWSSAAAAVPQSETAKLPPPPSPAEISAVEALLQWSSDGAAAIRKRLSQNSCFGALTPTATDAEIEARLGSPDAERAWELQGLPWATTSRAAFQVVRPSGLDEYVLFDLVEQSGSWRIDCLSTWGEAIGWERPQALGVPWRLRTSPSPTPRLTLGLLLAAAGLLVLGWRRRSWLVLPGMVALAGLSCSRQQQEETQAREAWTMPRLAPALAVRDALDADLGVEAVAARVAEVAAGPARELGARWLVQLEIQSGKLLDAQARLDSLTDETALDAILRGRLALLRGESTAADEAWSQASERFPVVDGLRLELATSLFMLGDEVAGQAGLSTLVDASSRLARVWYTVASLVTIDGNVNRGAELFKVGWQLEPRERADVVRSPVNAYLAAQAELVEALNLGPVAEPPRPPSRARPTATTPLVVPPHLEVSTTGELLRAHGGVFELLVPGAASVAPEGTPIEDAAARRRALEERALRQVLAARDKASADSLLASPVLRDRITTAATALARKRNWRALIDLTAGLDADTAEAVPPTLGRLRAAALRQEGQLAASRTLLVRVAGEAAAARRRDPWLFLQLAELMMDLGAYEDADRAAVIGETQLAFLSINSMRPRIEMERRLAKDFKTIETKHFLLRFPPAGDATVAAAMGDVLEAEVDILLPWIPWRPDPSERVEVHLLWFDDFMEHYSIGGTAIASFDGALRLPLAAVKALPPVVHEILVHELAHAMLDGATNGRAPSWLHEGLAQHLEPVQHPENLIPDYTKSDRRISIPLVEAVFEGRPRPDLISIAYDEAIWIARYIEHRWGRKGLHQLIAALQANSDDEAALMAAFGVDFAELDRATWQWVLEDVPAGRWKPRPDRKIGTKIFQQTVREAAASGPRLAGGSGRLDSRNYHQLSAAELHTLQEHLESFEKGLIPVLKGVFEWRPARAQSQTEAMKAACATMVAAPLPQLQRSPSEPQERLRNKAAKAVREIVGLQGACRRNAWSEVDQRIRVVSEELNQVHAFVDDARRNRS